MPLPTLHNTIRASQLYPDRIRINYRYRLPAPVSYQTAVRVLQGRGFSRVGHQLQFRGLYESARYEAAINAFVSIPGDRSFLNIYIDINPLTSIRQSTEGGAGERSFDGRTNWLNADNLRADNRWIWSQSNDLIWAREAVASEFADALIYEFGLPSVGAYQGATVDRMDVTCDFAASDPAITVLQVRPAFQSAFTATRTNALPGASGASERIQGEVVIMHGNWRTGAVFRLYPKTDRRIRLECEIRAYGFRNLSIPRDLSRYESDFESFFGNVARRVVPAFNNILRGVSSNVPAGGSPVELLLGILGTVRDEDFARVFVSQLVATDRVTSRLGGDRIRRLASRGYLERVGHGLYRLRPEWREPFERVAGCLIEQNTGFRMGAAI